VHVMCSVEYDSYIVVSFANATIVLKIDEQVEEVSEAVSGFVQSSPTLNVFQIGEETVLQVLSQALRSIRTAQRVHEWRSPGSKAITHAAVNKRQIVISLTYVVSARALGWVLLLLCFALLTGTLLLYLID
jgi:splicing factor 3B subunit 3